MTLTKEVKDLYDKNFKYLKKEIKEDLRRWTPENQITPLKMGLRAEQRILT